MSKALISQDEDYFYRINPNIEDFELTDSDVEEVDEETLRRWVKTSQDFWAVQLEIWEQIGRKRRNK